MAVHQTLPNGIELTIERVGNEQTPVVMIDNFPVLPERPTSLDGFAPDKHSYYPGLRKVLPKPYVVKALQSIYMALYDIYQVPKHKQLKVLDNYFSLITTQPQELELLQRLPHFDSTHEHYFAVLHYLDENPHGGTGLFRHNKTGFESIIEANIEQYLETCQQEITEYGEPAQLFPSQSTQQFELYYQIPYKPNRVAIYPGKLLHSTIVNVATDVSDNLAGGRLTANIFIEYK